MSNEKANAGKILAQSGVILKNEGKGKDWLLCEIHIDRSRDDPIVPSIHPIAPIKRRPPLHIFNHPTEEMDLPPLRRTTSTPRAGVRSLPLEPVPAVMLSRCDACGQKCGRQTLPPRLAGRLRVRICGMQGGREGIGSRI